MLCVCIGSRLDMERFKADHDLTCNKAKRFSGYHYKARIEDRIITVGMFPAGRIVFTGLKSEADERLCRLILPEILLYTTQVPSQVIISKAKIVKKVKLPKILQLVKQKLKKKKKHVKKSSN